MVAAPKRAASKDAAPATKKVKFDKTASKKNPFVGKPGVKFNKGGSGSGPAGKFNTKFQKPAGKFIKKEGDINVEKKFDNDQQKAAAEKPDWNKYKQDKKDLKLKRKGTKDLFEVTAQAKILYEQLKCKSTPNKEDLCRQLHALIRDGETYQKLVLAHDTARIVQCMLKKSPVDIKNEISEKLTPIFDQMAISKYAHFCASRLIQHATTDARAKVINSIFGNVVKMAYHTHGSSIVDNIYVSWASSQQKAYMRQEFYGDLYKKSKDSSVKSIADTYRDSGHMKLAVVNAVKSHLNHLVNKKLVDNGLVHSVLLDYLNECNEEDRNEIITAYSPFIPSLASTKDGTRASIICFWNSIVKDRRAIVKTLREHLVKLCTHEHGHTLILAIVNSMDDTKALKKAIFDHLFSDIDKLITNQWGRRVIEWFVSPGISTTFHPHINAVLEEGLKFSKKDKEVRRAELLEAVEEPICNAIATNPTLWIRGGNTGLATAAILKNCRGAHLKKAFDALATVVCTPDWKVTVKEIEEVTNEESEPVVKTEGDGAPLKIKKKKVFAGNEEETPKEPEELVLGVEHAGLHIILKKIFKYGKDNDVKFSSSVADQLTEEIVENWLPLNRASFLILNAYENATDETKSALKSLVTKKIKLLKQQKHAASKLLLKNMQLK